MTVRYTPNRGPLGIVGIATGPAVVAALRAVAEKGREYAEAIAPIESGEYKSSFQVDMDTRGEGQKKRARANLANTSPHAAAVEFGNVHARGQHVLGRTRGHLGGSS